VCGYFNEVKIRPKRSDKLDSNIEIDSIDKQIIDGLIAGKTQKQLASKTGKTPACICKRVSALVKSNILIKKSRFVHELNPNLKSDEFSAVQVHKAQVKITITGNMNAYKRFFDEVKGNRVKLENWIKKIIIINNIKFQLNPKSMIFWVTAVGRDVNSAMDNLRFKSVEITRYFEEKHGFKCAFPEFKFATGKQKLHYTPVIINRSEFDLMAETWYSDNSHPGLFETIRAGTADRIKRNLSIDLESRLGKLDEKINNRDEIKPVLDDLKSEIKGLTATFTDFINVMKSMISTNEINNTIKTNQTMVI